MPLRHSDYNSPPWFTKLPDGLCNYIKSELAQLHLLCVPFTLSKTFLHWSQVSPMLQSTASLYCESDWRDPTPILSLQHNLRHPLSMASVFIGRGNAVAWLNRKWSRVRSVPDELVWLVLAFTSAVFKIITFQWAIKRLVSWMYQCVVCIVS